MVLQSREENDRVKGVIVRGMEMPTNCSDCPLNYDQMMCIVTGTRWWSDTMVLMGFDSDKERLHDCPLIETVIEDEVVIPLGTLSKILDGDRTTYDFSEYICEVNGLACSGCSLFCEHRRVRE